MEVNLQFSNGVIEILGLYSPLDNLFLAIAYRQPDYSAGGNSSTINELKPAMEKLQQALADIGEPTPNILICGDFKVSRRSFLGISNNKQPSGRHAQFQISNVLPRRGVFLTEQRRLSFSEQRREPSWLV